MPSEVPTGTRSRAALLRRDNWCLREVDVFRGGPRVSWERDSESPRELAGKEAVTEDIRVPMALAVTL